MTVKYNVNEIVRSTMIVPPIIAEAVNEVANEGRIAKQGELIEWFINSVSMVLASSPNALGRLKHVRNNGASFRLEFENTTVKAVPLHTADNVIIAFDYTGNNPTDNEQHNGKVEMPSDILNLIVYSYNTDDVNGRLLDFDYLSKQFDNAAYAYNAMLDADEEKANNENDDTDNTDD